MPHIADNEQYKSFLRTLTPEELVEHASQMRKAAFAVKTRYLTMRRAALDGDVVRAQALSAECENTPVEDPDENSYTLWVQKSWL